MSSSPCQAKGEGMDRAQLHLPPSIIQCIILYFISTQAYAFTLCSPHSTAQCLFQREQTINIGIGIISPFVVCSLLFLTRLQTERLHHCWWLLCHGHYSCWSNLSLTFDLGFSFLSFLSIAITRVQSATKSQFVTLFLCKETNPSTLDNFSSLTCLWKHTHFNIPLT